MTAAKPTVLVADDDEQLVAMLEDVLTRDFRVVTAHNGASALVQFARYPVDIVVTDLAMPGYNGLDVAAKCKAAKPSIPVVLLTAWDVLVTDEDRERNGVDAVVAKPVRVHEFSDFLLTRVPLKRVTS